VESITLPEIFPSEIFSLLAGMIRTKINNKKGTKTFMKGNSK